MAEYIDRKTLLQDISETVVFTVRKGVHLPTAEMKGANKVIERIKSSPIADVQEVKHGKWIWQESGEEDYEQYYVCSICKEKCYFKAKFCADCGAKMDGDV